LAKKVKNPFQKEKALHTLLTKYTERINGEFFRISVETALDFFDLMDGEMWNEQQNLNVQHNLNLNININENFMNRTTENIASKIVNNLIENNFVAQEHDIMTDKSYCRDMTKCFMNGQKIRHTIGNNKTWIGIYNSSKNKIVHNGIFYGSLSGFTGAHYAIERPERTNRSNGWAECECEVNGKWISTFNL
jgi:hypothetical protein